MTFRHTASCEGSAALQHHFVLRPLRIVMIPSLSLHPILGLHHRVCVCVYSPLLPSSGCTSVCVCVFTHPCSHPRAAPAYTVRPPLGFVLVAVAMTAVRRVAYYPRYVGCQLSLQVHNGQLQVHKGQHSVFHHVPTRPFPSKYNKHHNFSHLCPGFTFSHACAQI